MVCSYGSFSLRFPRTAVTSYSLTEVPMLLDITYQPQIQCGSRDSVANRKCYWISVPAFWRESRFFMMMIPFQMFFLLWKEAALFTTMEEAQSHRRAAQFSPTHRLWISTEWGLNPCSTSYQLGEFLMSPTSLFSFLDRGDNNYPIALLTVR